MHFLAPSVYGHVLLKTGCWVSLRSCLQAHPCVKKRHLFQNMSQLYLHIDAHLCSSISEASLQPFTLSLSPLFLNSKDRTLLLFTPIKMKILCEGQYWMLLPVIYIFGLPNDPEAGMKRDWRLCLKSSGMMADGVVMGGREKRIWKVEDIEDKLLVLYFTS